MIEHRTPPPTASSRRLRQNKRRSGVWGRVLWLAVWGSAMWWRGCARRVIWWRRCRRRRWRERARRPCARWSLLGGRLRSAVEALLLGATAALEAVRAGAGRAALRDEARLGARAAARKAAVGGRLAQMPNVADALARGELTAEHAEVLADTARRTSPDAVNDAQALHQSAAQVSPEVLRREAEAFAVRWDPAGAQGELGRQRRDRGAALFRDDESGMGVLNARFDPISFALVRQAVETYNDALWRLDAGRDGTPAQVRDNRQRLADSVFEMLTGRNALHTQQHPTQPTADSPTGPTPAPTPSTPSRTGSEMLAHSGAIATHRTAARQATAGDGPTGTAPHAGPPPAGANAPLADDDALPVGAHTLPARTNAPPAGAIGSSDADSGECTCGAAEGSDLPGRSVSRFAPSHAPNQLVIVADIGVIDGTDPHGRCDVLGAGPVPASILDTISPDTRITAALFGGPGQLLWLGRSRRHASSAQQLAVAIRDRGCVLCGAPMHRCDLHHIDEWTADNGPTDLPNLAALCGDCHNNLHKSKRKLHHENRTGPPTETASAAPTKPTGRDSPDGLGDSSGRDSPGGPDGPTSQHGPS